MKFFLLLSLLISFGSVFLHVTQGVPCYNNGNNRNSTIQIDQVLQEKNSNSSLRMDHMSQGDLVRGPPPPRGPPEPREFSWDNDAPPPFDSMHYHHPDMRGPPPPRPPPPRG